MNRLLTEKEIEALPLTNLGGNVDDLGIAEAQDKKTLRAVGEWLESKMIAVPLRGVEWHIRLDHIETFLRGEFPE